jgi:hypothetical protein
MKAFALNRSHRDRDSKETRLELAAPNQKLHRLARCARQAMSCTRLMTHRIEETLDNLAPEPN